MKAETELKGGKVNYYLVDVTHPQRINQPAYQAECEDIIEALELNPDEANIFKEIWRSANARKNNGKPGHSPLYGAEKIVHYAERILRRMKRQFPKDQATSGYMSVLDPKLTTDNLEFTERLKSVGVKIESNPVEFKGIVDGAPVYGAKDEDHK